MDINARKLDLINWIASTESDELVSLLEQFKEAEQATDDWWNALSDQRKTKIEASAEQAEAGNTIPNKQVMTNIRSKLNL